MDSSAQFQQILKHVDEDLEKIEQKYASHPLKPPKSTNISDPKDELRILSEEFETLGFPPLNLSQGPRKLLADVTNNAYSLIQLHRKKTSEISDLSLQRVMDKHKKRDHNKILDDLRSQISTSEARICGLENKLVKSNHEVVALKNTLSESKEEIVKLKRYHKSKEKQFLSEIHSLKKEIVALGIGLDPKTGKPYDKDMRTTKLITKYQQNDEVQKSVIKKLEENNASIARDILNLREELAMTYVNDN